MRMHESIRGKGPSYYTIKMHDANNGLATWGWGWGWGCGSGYLSYGYTSTVALNEAAKIIIIRSHHIHLSILLHQAVSACNGTGFFTCAKEPIER